MGHALLNRESITALAFLLLFISRAQPSAIFSREMPARRPVLPAALALPAALILITVSAFWRNLNMPLLHDSYGLVLLASQQSLSDVVHLLYVHPTSGDFFFRPLSYFAYWLYSKWAHFDAFRWHLFSLILHVVNTLLSYLLARRLSFRRLPAFTAALVFALHGSRPEAVSWAAARFDLLAMLFVLLTLLAVNRLLDTGRTFWYFPMVLCAAAALLSKESAYCLPFLVAAMLFLRPVNEASRSTRLLAVLFATCGLVFLYRYWVIGGVGGYGAASGHPMMLHFSLIRSVNALFFRQWALLFFPINWSEAPGALLTIGIIAMAVLMTSLLIRPKGQRTALLAALGMILAAALPVEQLLLIGPDLSGARVLYLPVLGVALFWAVALQALATPRAQTLAAAGLLFFHATALSHNLAIWREVALLSQGSCAFIASEIAREKTPIAVLNLPATWKGVYFLNNSFPACVMFNSADFNSARLNSPRLLQGPPAIGAGPTVGFRNYRWNDKTRQFQKLTSIYSRAY